MVKIIGRTFATLILIIFFINFISADFSIGNRSNSIATSYGSGANITGWVNISLEDVPSDSSVTSSLGGSIKLLDLLKKTSNSGFIKICSKADCTSDYLLGNEESSKTLELSQGQSVPLGFNISGGSLSTEIIGNINQFYFNLTSNNPETEIFPLSLDLLNDENLEWVAYVTGDYGDENFGCFDNSDIKTEIILDTKYCERINLDKTPQLEIGSWVEGSGDATFGLTIEKVIGEQIGECSTSVSGIVGIKRAACIPLDSGRNFSVKEDNSDYFVCIEKNSGSTYQISYKENGVCGFSSPTGDYPGFYNYDFEIFARPKRYAANMNFKFDTNEVKRSTNFATSIESYVKSYITQIYSNNCSKGCIIPLRIFSGLNQTITISSISIGYVSGVQKYATKIYNASEVPGKINSDFQLLYLNEAGFKVPSDYGEKTMTIKLEGENIFSGKVSVERVPTVDNLLPTATAVKYPTKFKASIQGNVTQYTWDFGDGGYETSLVNEIIHTYNEVGGYTLKITVKDAAGKNSTKAFDINVGPASDIVPLLLTDMEINIQEIQSKLLNFSSFEQQSLNRLFNFDKAEENITKLRDMAFNATSDAQFENILGQILAMDVPETITKTSSAQNIFFFSKGENIGLGVLKEIGGGNYNQDREEKYKEAVLAWNNDNIVATVTFDEISAVYETGSTPVLNTFDFDITKLGEDNAYFVIEDLEDLFFAEDYSETEADGYIYIELNDINRIVFSTTEDVDFSTLPAFISTNLENLVVAEWSPFEETGELKKWIIFVIIVIGILFVALVAWIFLQLWYKRKYENYLFRNRNNLYNLINYIENEKKKGTIEREVISKLRKAGWNAEQIRYALRKHAGKRTGLPEIPIEKILKKKNNNGESKY